MTSKNGHPLDKSVKSKWKWNQEQHKVRTNDKFLQTAVVEICYKVYLLAFSEGDFGNPLANARGYEIIWMANVILQMCSCKSSRKAMTMVLTTPHPGRVWALGTFSHGARHTPRPSLSPGSRNYSKQGTQSMVWVVVWMGMEDRNCLHGCRPTGDHHKAPTLKTDP